MSIERVGRRGTLTLRPGIYSDFSPLVYHAGLYAASAAVLKLAGFVFFLWLARTLSVDDYATWGLLYALQTGVTSLGLVGIMEAVVGLLRRHRTVDDQARLFAAANTVFVATAAGTILFAACLFVTFLGNTGSSLATITYVLASAGLLAHSSLQAQIVRLEERHLASLCFNFLVPFSGLTGSVVAFAFENTIQSFFLGSTVGLAISSLGARIKRIGFYSYTKALSELRPILLRVGPFIVVTFLGWLGGYGNSYIVNLMFDSAEVAKFTLAFMLSAILQLIATAMNQVWSPRFYRMIQDLPIDQVEMKNRQFCRLQGIALGIAGGGLIGLYPLAVDVLGGNLIHYRSVSLELFLLVLSYIVLIPYWKCQNYLLAYDKGQSMMRIHVATSMAGIAALVSLMLVFGPLGIYIGFLSQMALRSVGALVVSRRQWAVTANFDAISAGSALTFMGFVVAVG